MGSLAGLDTEVVLERILDQSVPGFADVSDELSGAHRAAWAASTPRLLELCRVRMAMLLGCAIEVNSRTPDSGVDDATLRSLAAWPTDPRFDDTDRACLAFAEHWLIDVASIDDATVAAVRDHLGDDGLLDFVSALLVVEQRIRLRLMWDRLLGGAPA
jgi:alkylhydroperoxidase family enzyme